MSTIEGNGVALALSLIVIFSVVFANWEPASLTTAGARLAHRKSPSKKPRINRIGEPQSPAIRHLLGGCGLRAPGRDADAHPARSVRARGGCDQRGGGERIGPARGRVGAPRAGCRTGTTPQGARKLRTDEGRLPLA